jgi:hypothetical protein
MRGKRDVLLTRGVSFELGKILPSLLSGALALVRIAGWGGCADNE